MMSFNNERIVHKTVLIVLKILITLYNVCAVPWRCTVPWISILSTVGDVQYRGEYHDECGGYLEYRGGNKSFVI